VTVNLESLTATGLPGGFSGIETLTGSSSYADTLIGRDSGSTFHITGVNSGDADGLIAFSGFANLTGGAGNDTFAFLPGGSFSGNLDGGAARTGWITRLCRGCHRQSADPLGDRHQRTTVNINNILGSAMTTA